MEPEVYQMQVEVFGVVSSSTSCTFILRQAENDSAPRITSRFYVDNYQDSFDIIDEAISVSTQRADLLAEGGFNLTQWVASSRTVLEQLAGLNGEKTELNLELEDLPASKTLGLVWNCQTDQIQVKIDPRVGQVPGSKRTLLQSIAGIYNPQHLLAPVTMTAKLIQQQLWQAKLDWDEDLPYELQQKWDRWTCSLARLNDLQLDRCLQPSPHSSLQIHAFSHAYQDGYAYVYLRSTIGDQSTCRFIIGNDKCYQFNLDDWVQLRQSRLIVSAPAYLIDLITIHRPYRDLHPTTILLVNQSFRSKGYGDRAFAVASPSV